MFNKLFLLLLLCSCSRIPDWQEFEALAFLKLHPVHAVDILRKDLVNQERSLQRPAFSWQPLLKLYALSDRAFFEKGYCLSYKIPSEYARGRVKIFAVGAQQDCDHFDMAQEVLELSPVDQLLVYLTGEKKMILPNEEELEAFHLGLVIGRGHHFKAIKIPLLNLAPERIREKRSKKTSYKRTRHSNGLEKSFLPGVLFFPGIGRKPQKVVHYLEGPRIKCHELDKNCQTVGSYRCGQCRYGFYEVVPTKCQFSGDKYCGQENCGEKNQPACYRGFEFSMKKIRTGCYDGHPAAYCKSGLKSYCWEGLLVCQ